MDRRRHGYGDRLREKIAALEAEASREIRLDALHVLTHHPDRAAAAVEFLGATLKAPAAAPGPDPVHVLIAAHRAAYANWDRLSNVSANLHHGDPAHPAAQAATGAASGPEAAAFEALVSARPTTPAGAAALAAYLVEAVAAVRIDPDPSDGERALVNVAGALARLGPARDGSSAEEPAPHPDAALFALGAEF